VPSKVKANDLRDARDKIEVRRGRVERAREALRNAMR